MQNLVQYWKFVTECMVPKMAYWYSPVVFHR